MLKQSELEILSCFFPRLENLPAKSIEKKTGFSHDKTFRILKNLVDKKLLVKKQIGGTNIFEIKRTDRDSLYQVFVYYATKRRLWLKQRHVLLYRRLYEFMNEVRPEGSVILFGSYAKGKETEKSDVDLLVVATNKRVEKIAQTYQTKYGLVVRPAVIVPDDFKNIKADNATFWNDLIDYGIILDGLDYYFKEVYWNEQYH